MTDLLVEIIEQGLIFSILGFGVFITFKVLDFADMTTDGSFILGASIFGSLIAHVKVHPIIALFIVMIGGALAGLCTGILHIKLKISSLLSGIIVMTALYTVNLRVLKSPNLPLFRERTLFTMVQELFSKIGLPTSYSKLILLVIVVFGLKLLFDWFLQTKLGMLLRTAGDNPQLLAQLGANIDHLKFIGLMLSNALVAFAGAIMAQHQRNADVNAGAGMLVIGLTAIIIGMTIFKKRDGYWFKATTMIMVGAIIFRGLQAFTLLLGLPSEDFKLISMVLVVAALTISNEPWKRRRKVKRVKQEEEKWHVNHQVSQESL